MNILMVVWGTLPEVCLRTVRRSGGELVLLPLLSATRISPVQRRGRSTLSAQVSLVMLAWAKCYET
jgi:hypothetical protein